MAFEPGWEDRHKSRRPPEGKSKRGFLPGQIVRRINGWTPMRVVRHDYELGLVEVIYCNRYVGLVQQDPDHVDPDRLVLITDLDRECSACVTRYERLTKADVDQLKKQAKPQAKKGKTMAKDLYQTKENPPRFGTILTTNSEGKAVVEMRGAGGAVELFDPAQLEVVLPYTVSVTFLGGSTTRYAYLAKAGDVEVGDLLLIDDASLSLATVFAIDTKSRDATKPLKGRKLVTTAL